MSSQNALSDNNNVKTALACLNTDSKQGTNLVRIALNPVNNGIKVDTTSSISFTMTSIDPRDENYHGCMTFTGSDNLLYPWVATSTGNVLVSTI